VQSVRYRFVWGGSSRWRKVKVNLTAKCEKGAADVRIRNMRRRRRRRKKKKKKKKGYKVG
jgi:hypothetical protein